MTELLDYVVLKKHHQFRKSPELFADLAEKFKAEGLTPIERMTRRFEILSEAETPVFLPDEKICFMRTIQKLPDCFTKDEWKELKSKYHIHEIGYMSNLSPNYEDAIRNGLLAKRESADEYGKRIIDAILALTKRYREEAVKQGKNDIAEVLERVPAYGARNFREALQSFRILHFALWLEGDYHNTVGRFDKYMYPYFKADMDAGVYTDESVLDLICDFFISFNKDSDLYNGIQQGDNGQSLVLGGIDEDGNDVYSRLSELCLIASKKLLLIDPKINLRVNKNTPLEVYEFASELTKAGLGFPQYSNDDVVIDALLKHGYELRDARDYVVAACWEFIIPKCGADVNNIGDLNFPGVVDTVLREKFMDCDTFEDFMSAVKEEIFKQCDILTK
ncbi:MAG: pyruvate formate lyase family protein, partial [Clostridia bacterium]|nr:pyruvate formate lyase family protein [Clostridia bacterium]